MKKKFLSIFIIALALISPLFFLGSFNDENSLRVKADAMTISNLGSVGSAGEYILNSDVDIGGSHNPIGTEDAPFTGVFDGGGYVVTISSIGSLVQGKFQGIFGYAVGATIKNVKIICEDVNLGLSFSADSSEYFVGMLLGKGSGVTIENCEVEGRILSDGYDVQSKLTFGGIVGSVDSLSTIKNCGSYIDATFNCNLTNQYSIKLGGIVGELSDSSSMTYCVGYNNFAVNNESESVSVEINQGGLVGNINGAGTKIINCASTSSFTNTLGAGDACFTGGLIGSITNVKPASGNIASSGYNYTHNGVQGNKFYGNSSEIAYNYLSNSTKDYVSQISSGIMGAENFFTTDNYSECGIIWYELLPAWDFSSIWIIASDQAKLQQFQTFEIKLVTQMADPMPLDAIYNTLTDTTIYTAVDHIYSYGEDATFEIEFTKDGAGIDIYKGFYEINDILLDGVSIGYADFPSNQVETATETTITKGLKRGEEYIFKLDIITTKADGSIRFVFTVKAEHSTRGTYSFRTSEIPYFAYIVAEDGGLVSSSRNQNAPTYQALEPRQLTKDRSMEIRAVPSYQHVFTKWTMWEQIDEAVYTLNADKTAEYFKYTLTDRTTGEEVHSYWHILDITDETIANGFKSSDYRIVFGENLFTSNFMLKANFEKRVFSLNVMNIDVNKINKIELFYNSNTQNYVFDGETTNKDFIELDQNEAVSMKVYLKPGYVIDEEGFPQKLKVDLADKTEVEIDGQKSKVYTFLVSTSSLKELVNAQNQFSFELVVDEEEQGPTGGVSLWLIIGLSAGGALILIVAIILIVKFTRRGGGGGKNNKKAEAKAREDEYRQMFR